MVVQLITVIILIILSVEDICYKKVNIWVPLFGIIVVTFTQIMILEFDIGDILQSIIPGVVLIASAYATKEAIGIADGIVMCLTGLTFDIVTSVLMIFISFGMAAVFCLMGIVFKRVGRKTEIPFLPFILSGYIMTIAVI